MSLKKASVAGPAKKPEVAILHAVQMFLSEMTQMQVFRAISAARTHSKLRPTMRISRIKKKKVM
jgi:anaerobic ribonucleoside-triphosphate reductase